MWKCPEIEKLKPLDNEKMTWETLNRLIEKGNKNEKNTENLFGKSFAFKYK